MTYSPPPPPHNPAWPPPGAPPPPPPGAPPPPGVPKRRRNTRTILLVVGIVLVLCCAGAGAGGFALYRLVDDATEPVREETRAFLNDLRGADYATAYGRLCAQARSSYSQDDFEAAVRARGLDRTVAENFSGVSIQWNNGVGTGSVRAQLTLDDDTAFTHTFQLLNEDDAWRICGTPF